MFAFRRRGILLLTLFFLVLIPFQYTWADEGPDLLDTPAYVPEVLTFFNRELQSAMSYTGGRDSQSDFLKSEWYTCVVYEFDAGESDSSNLNFLGGFHFRIGSLRIPFFTAVTAEVIDVGSFYSGYLGFFGGSGLVYDNPWFSLGTFAGYYDTRKYTKYESLRLTDTGEGTFSFSVIPIVYTGEMLYLNILRDIIMGLNATLNGINDISFKFRFRPFPFFGGTFNTSVYCLRESYASLAKNFVYGAKIGSWHATAKLYDYFIWEWSLEGGYRNFYETRYDQYVSFKNSMFIRAGIDLVRKSRESTGGIRFDVFFDRQNIPKIGIYLVYKLNESQPFNIISGAELGKFAAFSFKMFQEISEK